VYAEPDTASEVVATIMQYDFSGLWTAKVAIIFIAAALVVAFFLKSDTIDTHPAEKIDIRKMIDQRLIVLSVFGMLVTFIKYATLRYSFETVVREMGGVPAQIGNIDAHYDILHIFGGFFAAWALSRNRRFRISVPGVVFLGMAIMSLQAFFAWWTNDLNMFLMSNLWAGFGMGVAYITLMSSSIKDCHPAYKMSRMGFFHSTYMFGIWIAPRVCEHIYNLTGQNMQNVYLACALGGITTAISLLGYYGKYVK
jgi:MFS family permease